MALIRERQRERGRKESGERSSRENLNDKQCF
jgi:hypothetical protein